MDNWTRKAALRLLEGATIPDEEAALGLSEHAFARKLTRDLGRPLHLISSREYTDHRALALIEYAQSKILESRRIRAQRASRKR